MAVSGLSQPLTPFLRVGPGGLEGDESMTRKDFELIAKVIKESGTTLDSDPAYIDAIADVADRFAIKLRLSNPRFDRAKFMVACGF